MTEPLVTVLAPPSSRARPRSWHAAAGRIAIYERPCWLFAVILAVCGCLWSGVAIAGHYDLADAKFISSEDAGKLERSGIVDTEFLLKAVSTPEGRAELAKRSGVALPALERYARICDLLRIDGVGPGMAMLFHEVGITSVPGLKDASVNPLHKKLLETNDSLHIMGVVPQVETLEAWIAQAAKLPLLVK